MRSMQPGTSPTAPPSQRNSAVGLVLKLALAASLVALVVSVARFFKPKPAETPPPPVATENTSDAADVTGSVPEPATARRRFASRGFAEAHPVFPRPIGGPIGSPETGSSTLVAVDSPPAGNGYLLAGRLPELQSRIDNAFARLEPPVFYQVPLEYEAELNRRLADIRMATNAARQFMLEWEALSIGA